MIKQVIVVRKDLNMRKGKLAAQVAHAAMKFIVDDLKFVSQDSKDFSRCEVHLSNQAREWLQNSFTKIVLGCTDLTHLEALELLAKLNGVPVKKITDNGTTEFNGVPTVTCIAIGPAEAEHIDKITGHLQPL